MDSIGRPAEQFPRLPRHALRRGAVAAGRSEKVWSKDVLQYGQ
jgi:hypothetical protein